MKTNIFTHLKSDFPSGLVVFLVALPLCLGIALASGAPLFSGIISGIIGGLIIGALSGSHVSVSGPAAGLTVIVLDAIVRLGSWEAFLTAVLLAGVIQFGLGVAKAGIISHYFPSSVIKGMLAAIGLILIMKQIPHAIGWDTDYEGDLSFFQPDGENTFSEIIRAFEFMQPAAALICLICLGILLIWEIPAVKNKTIFKLIPGGLVAVTAGILINEALKGIRPEWVLVGDHLVTIPAAGSVSEFIGQFTLPDLGILSNFSVYIAAFTIAIVASLETLLCIEATDKLDPYKRITSTNRELRAQGIGNIVAGLIGGLPMTSVIVRSSANIDAGARTKMSAIIHGILLLLSIILVPHVLNLIPLSALAAILLVVGYKLAKIPLFRKMYSLGMTQFIPFVVTVLAILFTDLLQGILIGMGVAIFYILRNVYRSPYHFEREDHDGHRQRINIKLAEEVTFINKGSMLLTLRSLPENSIVTIDGTRSKNIDYDVLEIIENFKETARHKNIDLRLKSIEENAETQITV